MNIQKKNIDEFLKKNQKYEIKVQFLPFDRGAWLLHSTKKNVCVGLYDTDDWAKDEALYIDYAFLDDGMKAWQISYRSDFFNERGFAELFKLLPKIFNGEKIFPDGNLLKPLHKNCNFAKENR